ncbi:sulfite exporter TauE/SafE family protein [Gramella sp. AN32]|uniref:Probable membrane transporter protein n=1 Tax=Christiangramia antarctica TaxID=2058158 RepID=A0ABW5X278_9FLAO|nr:sulfite exporter TauE/SafE family protein [Gramella sp. AN32]MCM4155762.1 hypothetical protein [Gramella sp. AN32]
MSEIILICLVFFIAGWVQGVIGFGFAVATTLLLVNNMNFTTLVFLNLSMSLTTAVIAMLSGKNLKMIDRGILIRLALTAFVGLILGLFIIEWVDSVILKKATLVVILIASLLSLSKTQSLFAHRRMVWFSGFLSGVLTPSTGINGPLVALHLNATLKDKIATRATMLAYLFVIMGMGVILMSWQQDFSNDTWSLLLKVLLPSIIGYAFGLWSFRQLSNGVFKKTVTVFLIASSLVSLIKLFS